jgi:putative radical SAM enzyme (TIGR03279 family)
MAVHIKDIEKNSLASKVCICAGDILISINDNDIRDVLDYRYYICEENLKIKYIRNEMQFEIIIKKAEYEDLGLVFETYLMDKHQSCKNKCIFCFIDQLPKGMRKSLYFKDDDSRLSFIFGNYITLTNLTELDINRIIKMRISPINISVHTTDPVLRVKMMANPNAGIALEALNLFAESGIKMNCQVVLCKNINDEENLDRTLLYLEKLYPAVESIAIVPVGLTKYRVGLKHLEAFNQDDAANIIYQVASYGDLLLEKYGTRLVYPADEFYLKAGIPIPEPEFYEEFRQLENGVGLVALMKSQFYDALNDYDSFIISTPRKISVATGTAANDFISNIVDETIKKWHNLVCNVFAIENHFFGKSVNVAGLIIGEDLITQLKGKDLGEILLIPSVMLRSECDVFLDDISIQDIERELNVRVQVVEIDGAAFLQALIGEN